MTGAAAGGDAPALELRGISKRFGPVVALADADIVVRRGSVHALLGENGAGKSTLMRIAFGLDRADAGTIEYFGRKGSGGSVAEAVAAGVGMVHQHLSVVDNLSAAENVVLGRSGLYRPAEARRLLEKLSVETGLVVRAAALARDLSIVEKQRLEILKALAFGARTLILDEPTAILAPAEVSDLLAWIRLFATQGGSVVFVTHKLREALAIADDVTVLRRGRVSARMPAASASEESLARAIFPEAPAVVLDDAVAGHAEAREESEIVARAQNVSIVIGGVSRIRDASFAVRRGDRLGVAAVDGSGHRELLLAAAGRIRPTSGTLQLPPRVAMIPADRMRDAVVPDFTLTENVALRDLGARRGTMPWRELNTRTAGLIRRYGIVAQSASVALRSLSGGNQQRLVVARELEDDAALVIADNPTRGLDLQAARFVHDELRRAADAGGAVLLHSSDLDEVLAFATRVLVVFGGRVRELPVDREMIGRAMLGAA